MSTDRRQFLTVAKEHLDKITIATIGAGFGGVYLYRWNAKRVIRRDLREMTNPVLTKKSHLELNRIPGDGEHDIKKFFQGVIFKIPPLVDRICSDEFVEQLAAVQSDEAKNKFLIETFTRLVVSHSQIRKRVESCADALGYKLDENWAACSLELANSWQLSLRPHADSIGAADLLKELEPTIQERLQRARNLAFGNDQMPFLRETERSLGKSAILLLELTRVMEGLYLPSFCIQAMHSSLENVRKYLRDRQNRYKNKIAREFVELSNRIGGTFRTELQMRVSNLHAWQREALMASIDKRAEDAVAWFA